jgi:hypothetical protein
MTFPHLKISSKIDIKNINLPTIYTTIIPYFREIFKFYLTILLTFTIKYDIQKNRSFKHIFSIGHFALDPINIMSKERFLFVL